MLDVRGWRHRRRDGVLSPRRKASVVASHASDTRRTLVETGTYLGDTTRQCTGSYDRIYTIELDEMLAQRAIRMFGDEASVTVIHGDSCEEVERLCGLISEPAVFWLDAHFSEGVTAKGPHDPPLEYELHAILQRSLPDVVLIDDARHMGVSEGYPSIDAIRSLVGVRALSFDVRDDIIRAHLS